VAHAALQKYNTPVVKHKSQIQVLNIAQTQHLPFSYAMLETGQYIMYTDKS